jgi:hypothetical protein
MGIHGYVPLAINEPTVKNVPEVRRILDQYDSRLPLEVIAEGDGSVGTLTLRQEMYEAEEWPSAVKVEDLPAEGAFNDIDLENEVVDSLHEKRGQRGLTTLLLELAPYLDSPLIVKAASFSSDGEFYRAAEWTTRPGAAEVEVKEIDFLEDE